MSRSAKASRSAVWSASLQASVVLTWLFAANVHAATLFDPARRFRALPTDHFVIYFHQGEERTAQRLAIIAEETWRTMRQPLGVEPPPRTHVVLVDQTELANGYATPLPYDTIVLYAVWPAGSEFIGETDDWLRVAFTHEFTHIVHLDRSEGWARPVRGIFGRATIAFPNLFLPIWQIEGLATYQESVVTGQGRLHAGDFAAVVRESAQQHALEPLDRVNGGLTDWPGGVAPYAYGVAFHQYLAERFGAESLAALARETARSLPYTGSRAFARVYHESLGELWRDYETSLKGVHTDPPLRNDVGADARVGPGRNGSVSPTRITHHGFIVLGPRFDPRSPGDIWYSLRDPHGFPALYRVSVEARQPQYVTTRYLGSTTAPARDVIYFDQQELRRNVGIYSDLYALTRATGHVERLTHEARLIDPDLSPDQSTIVAVQDRPGGRDLVLVRLKPDTTYATYAGVPTRSGVVSAFRRTIDVLISEPETQFNAPRWSPDGKRIAVERHRPGALSEIVVVDIDTRAVGVIAAFDRTRVVTPAWRPDGHAVVAAAAPEDRPFNLYEFSLEGASLPRQLTNASGGATWPDISPDGKTIVYVGYTIDGFDLFTIPYTPDDRGERRADLREERFIPADRRVRPMPDAQVGPYQATAAYSPLPTLRPTSWSPIVESDSSQVRAGAAVAGVDVLGYHFYSASATWLTAAPADATKPPTASPDWQLSYFYDRWQPTFFAAASSETSFFAGVATENGTPVNVTQRERQFQAGVLLPIRHARASHTALVSALIATDDYTASDQTASRERNAFRGAWATTTAHTYGYSISPEDGVAGGTTIEIVRKSFGAFDDSTIVTGDVRAYVRGVSAHHVVALRLAGGSSNGEPAAGRTFLLGGSNTDAGVVSFNSSALSLLRGFAANTFAGSHVALVNADYRFPIARPQRGLGTWPLFIHTVHAALFADVGNAWTKTFAADAIKTSLGCELSTNVVAGYVFPFTLATGAAWGHDRSGVVGDRATLYFRIGKAF
jgi:WD40 repeat protein